MGIMGGIAIVGMKPMFRLGWLPVHTVGYETARSPTRLLLELLRENEGGIDGEKEPRLIFLCACISSEEDPG